jgi:hypothetical protein
MACEIFGGDASSGAEKCLEPLGANVYRERLALTHAAVDRLDMQIADTLAGALALAPHD